ncbi:DUF4381 domain-containing protein [Microbulbifer bruguierae]|uniref:DUF4381 domain-containing protein n=1 Tax=Microbulbifer bruguierae TaxID=3029061 RepID=A0ABY8NH12_9GAMM|nr:DUF4381 domain-containing protein [Microbulbifer bruguierae]WGL17649.1 DUF4381 domain-containing protein [Microbulbifer bruguierae]
MQEPTPQSPPQETDAGPDPANTDPANSDPANTDPANTNPAAGEETLPDILAQLVPPPAPPAVSMWPVTPAAKGLSALLLLLLLLLIWRQIQIYRANAYRRAALAELVKSQDDPAQVAEILRRTALAAYPREQVAGLTGDDWLAFLNQSYPGNAFSGEVGRTLLQAPYRKAAPAQSSELARTARDWIRRHRVTRPTLFSSFLRRNVVEAAEPMEKTP